MEQYKIFVENAFPIEHLIGKLNLKCWTAIQKEIIPEQRTMKTFMMLSENLREQIEKCVRSYQIYHGSDADTENTYFLNVTETLDDFIAEVAIKLSTYLLEKTQGEQEKIVVILEAVLRCVLLDYLFISYQKKSVYQLSCCSAVVA